MVNIVDSRTSAAESLCQDIDIQIERSRQIMKTAELAISLTSYDWESVKQQVLILTAAFLAIYGLMNIMSYGLYCKKC